MTLTNDKADTMTKYEADRIYHVQVNPGKVVLWRGLSFGPRATPQVPGSDVADLVAQGATVVDPQHLPDVGLIA